MDTGEELCKQDHMPSFFVPGFAGDAMGGETLAEKMLETLIRTYRPSPDTRFQMAEPSYVRVLQTKVNEALDQRLALVQRWIAANIKQLPQENQLILNIVEKLNAATLGIRAATRLCSSGCPSCQLLCLRPHGHSGEHKCGTDHRCVLDCKVGVGNDQRERCVLV